MKKISKLIATQGLGIADLETVFDSLQLPTYWGEISARSCGNDQTAEDLCRLYQLLHGVEIAVYSKSSLKDAQLIAIAAYCSTYKNEYQSERLLRELCLECSIFDLAITPNQRTGLIRAFNAADSNKTPRTTLQKVLRDIHWMGHLINPITFRQAVVNYRLSNAPAALETERWVRYEFHSTWAQIKEQNMRQSRYALISKLTQGVNSCITI